MRQDCQHGQVGDELVGVEQGMPLQMKSSTEQAVPPYGNEKKSKQDISMMGEDASEHKSGNCVRPTTWLTLGGPVVEERLDPERCRRNHDAENPDAKEETADTDALLQDGHLTPGEQLLAETANAMAARTEEQEENDASKEAVECNDVHTRGQRVVVLWADLRVAWCPRQTECERPADSEEGAKEEGGRKGAHGGGGAEKAVGGGGGGGGGCRSGGDGARG